MFSKWLLHVAFLLFAMEELVISEKVKNLIVMDGQSLKLKCELLPSHTRLTWKFIDLLKNEKTLFYIGEKPEHEKYSFNCSIEMLQCSLELNQVSRSDAGTYYCSAGGGDTFLSQLEVYNLNVGTLTCHSNIGPQNSVTAVSDCKDVEATNLMQSCTLTYNGSWTNIPVSWRKKWNNGSIVDEKKSIPKYQGDQGQNRNITVELKEKVTAEMMSQTFECFIQDTSPLHQISPCNLALKTIRYARNRSDNNFKMEESHRKLMKCQADASQNLQCDYEWFSPNAQQLPLGYELQTKDMKSLGYYRCIATCELNNSKCKVLANEFELIYTSTSQLPIIVGVVVASVIIAIILLTAFCCYKKRKEAKTKSQKKGTEEKEMKSVVTANEPLLSSNSQNHPTATPTPVQGQSISKPSLTGQSHNGGGGSSGRKQSFRRGTSKGSQDFLTITEEGDNNQVTQMGRIPLNEVKGPVMGIGHLDNRIYCIAKNSHKLFVFVDSHPYNRLIPEEVVLADLVNPQALVACQESKSIYISDYSDKNFIYRVFPMVKEGNKISRGKMDGTPADIDVVSSKPNTIVVILKRDKKMHVEIYDSSVAKDSRGSVSESETWEKKYIISTGKDVILPLFICMFGSKEDATSPERLYLLYGSGTFKSGEFESYKISQINLETSLVYKSYDLKDICSTTSEKYVPTNMVSDYSKGGILVLDKKGQLVHLNSDLNICNIEANFGPSQNRLCFRPNGRMVILGSSSSSKPGLTCCKLKGCPATC